MLQETGLPGGYPMNGGFAATFLQRRPPAGAGIPLKGHGIPQASNDVEAAKSENGRYRRDGDAGLSNLLS